MAKIERNLLNQLYSEFTQLNSAYLSTELMSNYKDFETIFSNIKNNKTSILPDSLEHSLNRRINSAKSEKEKNFYVQKKSVYNKAYNLGLIGDQNNFNFSELKNIFFENQILMKDNELENKIVVLEEKIEKETKFLRKTEKEKIDSNLIKKQNNLILKLIDQLKDLKELKSKRREILEKLKNEDEILYSLNSKLNTSFDNDNIQN